MEAIDPTFFSTIATTSATFIGFGLLAPAVQAVSSRLFSRAQTCINERELFKKIAYLISLPLFICLGSLINSLLLLFYPKLTAIGIAIFFLLWGFIGLIWFKNVIKFSLPEVVKTKLIRLLLDYFPLGFLLLCFIVPFAVLITILIEIEFYDILNYIPGCSLLLILAGFIILLRNMLTPIEKGLSFPFTHIKPEFKKEKIEKPLLRVVSALKARRDEIKQLEKRKDLAKDETPYHISIAHSLSEIQYLGELLQKLINDVREKEAASSKVIKSLKKQCQELDLDEVKREEKSESKSPKGANKTLTLSDLFELDDRIRRISEEILPEFERVTSETRILLERLSKKEA